MKVVAFDSGVGGLTAVVPLLTVAPDIEILYFGDLANLPYGTKSRDQVRNIVERNFEWLLAEGTRALGGVDLALIACNTASALAMDIAEKVFGRAKVPVRGVIEAGCRSTLARAQSAPSRVVVLATPATVRSNAYADRITQLSPATEVVQLACPLFVPLVEDELLDGIAVEYIARRYLDGQIRPRDRVILGCTHYPFLRPALERLYPGCEWIDAGSAVLEDGLVTELVARRPSGKPSKKLEVAVSDHSLSAERFRALLARFAVPNLAASLRDLLAIPPA